jgi:hypothetical protein
MVHTPDEE